MDLLGLFGAVAAVAVYPGGLVLAATVPGRWLSPRWRHGPTVLSGSQLAILLLTCLAASCVPLSGSPAGRLPDPSGVPGNLVGALFLLVTAVSISERSSILALGVVTLPALAQAVSVGSGSFEVVATSPGTVSAVARWLAALAALVVAPWLAGDHRGSAPASSWGRVALVAGTVVVAAGLVLPAWSAGWPLGLRVAVASGGVVAVTAVLVRTAAILQRRTALAVAVGLAAAATVLAFVGR